MRSTVEGSDALEHPATGGDNDEDERAARGIFVGSSEHWTPECWRKSPDQLIEEARAMNMAGFMSAVHGKRTPDDPFYDRHARPF
jgi:hypothetical protein